MKIMQLLPALNSGGVERGTVDLARFLVAGGHQSVVVSNGGEMVKQLETEGSAHIEFPIHKKSLFSLLQVAPLREVISRERPDILHVRSRVPAWLTYLAWRTLPAETRPRLVSTAHGLYSINRYSAIMASTEQVIAISECVNDYLIKNYSKYLKRPPQVVYRGVDTKEFNSDVQAPESWHNQVLKEFPQLSGKRWLLLPGRLTRWKGQEDFINLIHQLIKHRSDIHGVILGGAEKNKQHYAEELQQRIQALGLNDRLTLVGHRSDIRHWYSASSLVYNLSQRPEPFGRTVIESAAMGTPIIGYNIGGPAESLHACFPQGLVDINDPRALFTRTQTLLDSPEQKPHLSAEFTLGRQAEHTLEIYKNLLGEPTGTTPSD
ncbi:glycosyltransferase family 4 protein [Microbulbifer sp. OS29]|uniref:Glycosyltransferase family 4 protein n=1 Tax=Microbulbifer okhotskensis TaxID=2926617 RepID=A0A9X2EPJ3_9GAMM|nr:glycosyltransferase family 4 protein [Microbulbifer okhotskensis]MCO1333363.1 glycosyltransferase family 4 protein [Microbulbifer okhotskensis]